MYLSKVRVISPRFFFMDRTSAYMTGLIVTGLPEVYVFGSSVLRSSRFPMRAEQKKCGSDIVRVTAPTIPVVPARKTRDFCRNFQTAKFNNPVFGSRQRRGARRASRQGSQPDTLQRLPSPSSDTERLSWQQLESEIPS